MNSSLFNTICVLLGLMVGSFVGGTLVKLRYGRYILKYKANPSRADLDEDIHKELQMIREHLLSIGEKL